MIAHVALTEAQFRDLVAGKIVEETGANGRITIRIILSDIGWDAMQKAIDDIRTDYWL
jgi:hypothetical protein